MARGRLISRSLGSSRKFHDVLSLGGKLGEFCQLLFPLIIANTDDFGRMPGDAFTIKNVVLPSSRRPEADFDTAISVMHEVGLVLRYVVDGAIYLEIENFREHQPGLHQRGTSRFPDPCPNAREFPAPADNSVLREGKRREGKVREEKGSEGGAHGARVADSLFDRFWAAYPKKKNRQDAEKAWAKRRPTEALLTAMLAAIEIQRQQPEFARDRFRFAPYPATWLNDARWTDEVDTAPLLVSDKTAANIAGDDEALRLIAAGEFGYGPRG